MKLSRFLPRSKARSSVVGGFVLAVILTVYATLAGMTASSSRRSSSEENLVRFARGRMRSKDGEIFEMGGNKAGRMQHAGEQMRRDVRRSIQTASKSGGFVKLVDFLPAVGTVDPVFDSQSTITITTHGTLRYMKHLAAMVSRWAGPISVAVFANDRDIGPTVRVISRLHLCDENVRNQASFHFFYEHYSPVSTNFGRFLYNGTCENLGMFNSDVKQSEDYRFYPVNAARNLARTNARTHFVLPLDIEFLPSENIIGKFLKMLTEDEVVRKITERPAARVFVIPAFEQKPEWERPGNKSELLKLLADERANFFHKHVCSQCHKMPYFERWLSAADDGNVLSVHFVTKWMPPYWEPIYIGTKGEPLYQERFRGYGLNKIQQLYEMCFLNYDFYILNNAFVVHHGISMPNDTLKQQRLPAMSTNANILERFSSELKKKYGSKKRCHFSRTDEIIGYFPNEAAAPLQASNHSGARTTNN